MLLLIWPKNDFRGTPYWVLHGVWLCILSSPWNEELLLPTKIWDDRDVEVGAKAGEGLERPQFQAENKKLRNESSISELEDFKGHNTCIAQ